MNAPIRRLSAVVALLFATLLVASTWIQVVQAKELQERPDNRRTLLATYARERGQILVGGAPVAKSVPSNDELKWLRTYPEAPPVPPRHRLLLVHLRRRRRARGHRERPALRVSPTSSSTAASPTC